MGNQGQVNRKVYFYGIDCGENPDGTPKLFPWKDLVSELKPKWDDPRRRKELYQDFNDLFDITCEVPGDDRLIVKKIWKTDLTEKTRGKDQKASPYDPDETLNEACHVVFFPKNIVGVEFNNRGPRGRLSVYLNDVTSDTIPKFELVDLARPTPMKQANDLDDLKYLKFVLKDTSLPEEGPIANLMGKLDNEIDEAGVEYEIIIRKAGRERFGKKTEKLMRKIARSVAGKANKLEISGTDHHSQKAEAKNLLNPLLVYDTKVVKIDGKIRRIDSSDMFEKISELHRRLEKNGEFKSAILIALKAS